MTDKNYASFSEFYPFYLNEHSDINCRRLHFLGSLLVLLLLGVSLLTVSYLYLLLLPVVGYGCAWAGHFFFQKNKPATFTYPLYSLIGDWVMFKDILAGRVKIF